MTVPLSRPRQEFPAATVDTITAVVVNWNTVDLLDSCLISLREHGSQQCQLSVVVVDNGSTDGSVEMLAERWPEVVVVANSENRGYQAANNQGIRVATGEHLLLINSDAMLQAGCLDAMIDRMHQDRRCAVVGPRLVYGDGSFQRWTAGRLPSLAAMASYSFFADRLAPRTGMWIGKDLDRPFTPGWVSSACMLVRRQALDDVGLMDERYFAYMDDVDLCSRIWQAGWTVWYEPAAVATHLMGQSTKRQTGKASPMALAGLLRWFEEQHGPRSTVALRAITATGFGLRAAVYGGVGVVRPEARAAARAHARHARQCLTVSPSEVSP